MPRETRISIFVGACMSTAIALAFPASALADRGGSPMPVRGKASAPVGYVDFCRRFQGECVARGPDRPVELTPQRWREMQQVNIAANRSVTPVTDSEYYNVEEFWTLPGAYGDCEDYVLIKRKWLIEQGWPTGALLMAVVFDEVGDGHAVLIARTTRGDFALDNKTDEIRPWHQTPYIYVKRQSVSDPNRWVSIGDRRIGVSTATPR